MSRTRLVSFVAIAAVFCCIAQPVLAAGPTVVPDGATAGSPDVIAGLEAWLEAAWSWLFGLAERASPH